MVTTDDHRTGTAQADGVHEAGIHQARVPLELRCRYPSKPCPRMRTTKRGGGLHRLCTLHQQRANRNQWLVDQRRRARLENGDSVPHAMRHGSDSRLNSTTDIPLQRAVHRTLDVLDANVVHPPLSDEDLKILLALLFDEEDDSLSSFSSTPEEYSTDVSSASWTS